MPGNFTVSQFRQWERALEFTTPGAATEAEITEARIASGLTLQGLSDGILLRISDETGIVTTLRMNAAMAIRLADAIPGAAKMYGWMGEDGVIDALRDRKRGS